MLYNLLFSATFSKDFSHLQGPPEGPEWSDFKKNTFAYVIQKHEDSITQSGKKHLFYISNTENYLAFGIYTSIHDYAKEGKVDKEFMLRRRGGDHSVHQGDLTKGDYPTEASIGGFWFKKDTSTLDATKFIDIDLDKLLKIYEQEIPPFWVRPRDAARQEVPDILESPLMINSQPTYDIKGCKKIINAINSGKKLLVKVNEKAEINLFYTLIHAVINGSITKNFNFCTAFKSKSFFVGQRVITIGTIRTKGKGAVKARPPINGTPSDNLNPRIYTTTDGDNVDELDEEFDLDDLDEDEIEFIADEPTQFSEPIAEPEPPQTTSVEKPVTVPKEQPKPQEPTVEPDPLEKAQKDTVEKLLKEEENTQKQTTLINKNSQEDAKKQVEKLIAETQEKETDKKQKDDESEVLQKVAQLLSDNNNNNSQNNDISADKEEKKKNKSKNIEDIKKAAMEKVAAAKKAALKKAQSAKKKTEAREELNVDETDIQE